VDGFRNASAIPVAAVVCRVGFLSGPKTYVVVGMLPRECVRAGR